MTLIAHDPPEAFAPVGPYTHAIEIIAPKRLLFTSGTMGLDMEGKAPEGIEAQLSMLWANIGATLSHAGMTPADIVKVTCFLADRAYRAANTEARKRFLGEHRAATTVIVAELLQDDWLVEIEIIAAA